MTTLAAQLDRESVLRSLVSHSVPGVERVDVEAGTVTRLLRVQPTPASGGRGAGSADAGADAASAAARPIPVTVAVCDDGVRVTLPGGGEPDTSTLERVREWFDLDTDVGAVGTAFGSDAVLGPLVRERPAVRIVGHPDAFEAAEQTVLGQQVSLAACRTFTGRLAAAYGTPGDGGLVAFPTADVVAGASLDELRAAVGVPVSRARTVIALAEEFASGLRMDRRSDAAEVRARLLALPGIGPWTVDYLALRVLRDPDAFPIGDLVLRRALGGITPAETLVLGERWRPWRAYATMHLWTADAARLATKATMRA